MNRPGVRIGPTAESGKGVIVTGGTKGAGEATVDRMARAGAEVIAAAHFAPETAVSQGRSIAADLSTSAGVEAIAGTVVQIQTRELKR